jgi:hypothetical protein
MMSITVENGAIRIVLDGWDRFLALKSELDIPIEQIAAVRVAPAGIGPKGIRAPGGAWPGKLYAGTWRGRGYKEFWNARGRKQNWIEIVLTGHEYARVVLEVDDPRALAAQIERARANPQ